MTYREILTWGEEQLTTAGIEEARIDAWYLLEHSAGIGRVAFISRQKEEMPEKAANFFKTLIKQRSLHMPLQQLTGSQEFMGLEFLVNEHVLIPRQDTELLVERAGAVCQGKKVLDLCTGSGCIILSLTKLYGVSEAVAVDISEEALAVAKKNGKRQGVSVRWILGDLLQPVTGTFDVIVSNPPYIEQKEINSLMPEVKEHEPLLALDGGVDGLDFYRRIVGEAGAYLTAGGYLFLEIGCNQSAAVEKLLQKAGFCGIRTEKDYSGLDRLVSARYGINEIE